MSIAYIRHIQCVVYSYILSNEWYAIVEKRENKCQTLLDGLKWKYVYIAISVFISLIKIMFECSSESNRNVEEICIALSDGWKVVEALSEHL